MSERGSVRFGNTTIGYEVRRSKRRRKTVQITMDGGGVQVAAPMTTPEDELRAIVRRRAPWILSHASSEMLETAPKRFVSGETLPYLGRNVRMIVDTGEVRLPEVRFDHWRFRVAVPEGLEGEERQQRIRRANAFGKRGARFPCETARDIPLLTLVGCGRYPPLATLDAWPPQTDAVPPQPDAVHRPCL